ncbi:MAG: sodium:calcium antiporter [Firmicutes bacterium]|nr:sodium:calcium antiporter [Bacillota bacterium]
MDFLIDIFLLLTGLLVILGGCELFTNGIEWMGKRFNVAEGAVGSILAAVGTALPETMVPLVAIIGSFFTKSTAANNIAVGAILGAPFMLGTLAFFVTGLAILIFTKQGKRTKDICVDSRYIIRDMSYFLIVFFVVVLSGLFRLPFAGKVILAVLLLGFYGYYIFITITQEGKVGEDLKALHFARNSEIPKRRWIFVQLFVSLALIIGGAHIFVVYLEKFASLIHAPPLILSLLLTPVATELPEKMSSVIWVSQKKDTLALGNITGAMVFQTCIPVSVGLIGTTWVFDGYCIASTLITLASGLTIYLLTSRKKCFSPSILMMGGIFYLIFILYILFSQK